ncbi:aquaporin [Bacteroidia bacterium]|jgi:glycerol uptake facilitator protein|nr:aquaporin [Bacteroidia bacterium]
MNYWKELAGEFIGTALLVFIGCGSVAITVVYYPLVLWQIALIWSFGVATAIYATNTYSFSHLNPAVTLAFSLAKKCEWKKLPAYFLAQLLGAVVASTLLLLLIHKDLAVYESAIQVVRGEASSFQSAVMFGEFFSDEVSHIAACFAEGIGTFMLVLIILFLTARDYGINRYIPLLIGLTVGGIILVIAPYTQAGLNPARDFGPRMVAYLGGWGKAAFPAENWSFLTVYILAPLAGSVAAYFVKSIFDKR